MNKISHKINKESLFNIKIRYYYYIIKKINNNLYIIFINKFIYLLDIKFSKLEKC